MSNSLDTCSVSEYNSEGTAQYFVCQMIQSGSVFIVFIVGGIKENER